MALVGSIGMPDGVLCCSLGEAKAAWFVAGGACGFLLFLCCLQQVGSLLLTRV